MLDTRVRKKTRFEIGNKIFSLSTLQHPPQKRSFCQRFRIQNTAASFHWKVQTHLRTMSISKTLFGFCLMTLFSVIYAAETHHPNKKSSEVTVKPTAYEMLEKFNFPKGILPEGVKGYVLHDDNRFEVFLDGDCEFEVEGYSLYYKSKITGTVGFGSLKDLDGVTVKVLFMWLGITEVNRGNGNIDFYVGPLSASFPLYNFDVSPRCGCGFNCLTTVSIS
ncbi:PREDICTED: uncharacterized protein LOC104589038 [Nelumbo nucifera]|uniref:Uncharacterized protein LOC104589038 n=1 Tax=Nelumbo nucifera TaxID=4432 RepID=A0A1U7Z0N4_NELNU|nr:PREDICTED: uncharacterized protein LOC104589038 [Nelumbo nucifera]